MAAGAAAAVEDPGGSSIQLTKKPQVTWVLLKRVMKYARPYIWLIMAMLLLTLVTSGLALLNPLILRDMIDRTLPNKDLHRLTWLVGALLAIPLLTSGLNVLLRQLNSRVGEGVTYDLRSTCSPICSACR